MTVVTPPWLPNELWRGVPLLAPENWSRATTWPDLSHASRETPKIDA
jgi:hypothetical protein